MQICEKMKYTFRLKTTVPCDVENWIECVDIALFYLKFKGDKLCHGNFYQKVLSFDDKTDVENGWNISTLNSRMFKSLKLKPTCCCCSVSSIVIKGK